MGYIKERNPLALRAEGVVERVLKVTAERNSSLLQFNEYKETKDNLEQNHFKENVI